MIDKYGRTITKTIANDGSVTYSTQHISIHYDVPPGDDVALHSFEKMMPEGYVAPAVPLNTQYNAQEFGQYLIDEFTTSNAQRNLTSDQLYALAQSLGPFYILLQTGSLQSFLDEIHNIPVDGTVITSAIIDLFRNAVAAYLAGL